MIQVSSYAQSGLFMDNKKLKNVINNKSLMIILISYFDNFLPFNISMT